MCYQSICTDISMMKNLHPGNAQLSCLGVNRIRCTQQVDWIIPLVDDNGILTVVVILYTILLLEAGRMLLSLHLMDLGHPINIKAR